MSVPRIHFRPEVWGPHYWFFLHTISHTYPIHPNEIIKRKYYDFIQNIPLFIPNTEIAHYVSELLERYPVQPYLGTRESFIRWVIFLHNKVNTALGKEEMGTMDAFESYVRQYDAPEVILHERMGISKFWITTGFIAFLVLIIVWKQ
jgi:hypothetical protein